MKICVITDMEYGSGASISAHRTAIGLGENRQNSVHYIYRYPFPGARYPRITKHSLAQNKISLIDSFVKKTFPLVGVNDYVLARRRLEYIRQLYEKERFLKCALLKLEFNLHFRLVSQKICRLLEEINPDIVNLHNIGAILRHSDVYKICRKYKVFWTMHDGYALNLYNLKYKLGNGEEKVYGKMLHYREQTPWLKRLIVKNECKIKFITPSEWLRRINLPVAKGLKEVIHIPNGVSDKEFYPEDKISARNRLGLDITKFYILFIANILSNDLKNLNVLVKALDLLDNTNIRIIAVGDATSAFKKRFRTVDFFDQTVDINVLRLFYAAANVTSINSLIENLPNIGLESLFCGRPIIGSNVGGVSEIVRTTSTGWLFNPYKPKQLAQIIRNLYENPELLNEYERKALAFAREKFSLSNHANKYSQEFARDFNPHKISCDKPNKTRSFGQQFNRIIERIPGELGILTGFSVSAVLVVWILDKLHGKTGISLTILSLLYGTLWLLHKKESLQKASSIEGLKKEIRNQQQKSLEATEDRFEARLLQQMRQINSTILQERKIVARTRKSDLEKLTAQLLKDHESILTKERIYTSEKLVDVKENLQKTISSLRKELENSIKQMPNESRVQSVEDACKGMTVSLTKGLAQHQRQMDEAILLMKKEVENRMVLAIGKEHRGWNNAIDELKAQNEEVLHGELQNHRNLIEQNQNQVLEILRDKYKTALDQFSSQFSHYRNRIEKEVHRLVDLEAKRQLKAINAFKDDIFDTITPELNGCLKSIDVECAERKQSIDVERNERVKGQSVLKQEFEKAVHLESEERSSNIKLVQNQWDKILEADRLKQIQALDKERSERIHSALSIDKKLNDSLESHQDKISGIVSRDLRELRDALAKHKEESVNNIAKERSQRNLAFARRDSRLRLPENCVFLITIPRTGSTWLMDALRCHPNIYIETMAMLYDHIPIVGARYPRDLGDGVDAVTEIEVSPGNGLQIPQFKLNGKYNGDLQNTMGKEYAIEKIHPAFLNWDFEPFLGGLGKLEGRMQSKFIYLVREPHAAITSYLNYQKRNPYWHSSPKHGAPYTYMRQSYEMIEKMRQRQRGLVLDYGELVNDFQNTMFSVFLHLWPNCRQEAIQKMIREMEKITARELRIRNQKTPFFSTKPGAISGPNGSLKNITEADRNELKTSVHFYNRIITCSKEPIDLIKREKS